MYNYMATLFEAGHDAVVDSNLVAFVLVFAGVYKDVVITAAVGEHDVLVSAEREDGKAAHVVSVEIADRIEYNMYFV